MTANEDPLHTGTIVNFSSAKISNDNIPYFEFALNPTSNPAAQQVFYVNLRMDYAEAVFKAAIIAWAEQSKVRVILDGSLGGMRVREILPANT
jgi:hypothetical protein